MVLFYVEYGSGTPLFLLHGFPFDHKIWGKVIGELRKDMRLITPDLRGHGRSMITGYKYSVADMAADVIELMDQLHIRESVVVGHSMGGYVALEMVRKYPERVSGLVLVSSHISADTSEKRQSRFEDIEKIRQQGAAAVLVDMPDKLTHDDIVKSYCRHAVERMDSAGAMGALHAMANRSASEDVWKALTIPTMVVAGSDDCLVPIEKSREFADLPINGTLEEINGIGHMPMLEVPEKVVIALAKFIQDI